MEHQKAIRLSKLRKLVPNDMFDKQMKRARQRDINSRKQIFNGQTEEEVERRQRRRTLQSSIY